MSIFSTDVSDDLVTIEENVDYLDQLVGEGKKFKEVKDLARGKIEADKYIEILKQRLDEATKEINTRTSLDSFLKEIKGAKEPQQPPVTPPQGSEPKTGLDDSEIEKRFEEYLARRESQRSSQTNLEKVQETLINQFGPEAKIVINKKAQELGMSVSALEQIASQSPSAFYRLVGVSEERNPVGGVQMPRSQVNPSQQVSNGVKNKAYFDKLKQVDRAKYFNPQTTVEMIKARKECEARGIPWE